MNVEKIIALILAALQILGGCAAASPALTSAESALTEAQQKSTVTDNAAPDKGDTALSEAIELSGKIVSLDKGMSAVQYDGDYGFDEFLGSGGASSDSEVVKYLMTNVLGGESGFSFSGGHFGCSTISAKTKDGTYIFGRNFDWQNCNAMIVKSVPESGYASISTVNMDFVSGTMNTGALPDEVQAIIALYAPLDGMNGKGLCVSVNMISDGSTISQDNGKPDLTTTTAVRMLLNNAATADEAVKLLRQYDIHSSMGLMVHFAIADANGKSVVVEYIDNEMSVVETPVVTNFYLTEGEKYGIGTQQSHDRYDKLMKYLNDNEASDMYGIRDALDSVSKHNYGTAESTEWSIVFDQSVGEVHYYHRENYKKSYVFGIEMR